VVILRLNGIELDGLPDIGQGFVEGFEFVKNLGPAKQQRIVDGVLLEHCVQFAEIGILLCLL